MADEEFSGNADNARATMTRIWRVWRTAHEMCRDRGYEIADSEIEISLQDFINKYSAVDGMPERSQLQFTARPSERMIKLHVPPPTRANPNPESTAGVVWVTFLNENALGAKEMRRVLEWGTRNNYRSGILVSHLPVSSAARKVTSAGSSLGCEVEIFLEEDLLINITHHTLVPKHILLSHEEKVALLKRYRLKETQLPRISRSDAVARYLGLKKGMVVKIIRNSETAGRYASYRVCAG